MGIIYKATNTVNGKVYVGKTVLTLSQRIRKHQAVRKHPRQVIQKALAKYGFDKFTWTVLEAVSDEALNDAEKRWIAALNSTHTNIGYNRSEGGDGGRRTVPDSPETRRKKSVGMRGKQNAKGLRKTPMSQAHKDAIALANKNPENGRIQGRKNTENGHMQKMRHIRWHVHRGIIMPSCSLCQ